MKKLLLLTLLATSGYSYPMLEQIKGGITGKALSYIQDHPYATTTFLGTSLALATLTVPYFYFKNSTKEERWDWSTIDTDTISFPKNFIWATAASAFQMEGGEGPDRKLIENTWTQGEKQLIPEKYSLFTIEGILKKLGIIETKKHPRTSEHERAGYASHHWTQYKDDIKLLKSIHVKAHRYSLEWSKIEPEEGIYDYDAIQHYLDYTQELIYNDIIPCPNFFHHTLPLWFAEKGGFEKAENIEKFVNYAVFIFKQFQQAGLLEKTKVWFAFNEAVGVTLAAYVDGKVPPYKKMQLKKAGIVTKNMLDAHIKIYDEFKKIDDSIIIGFIHVMMPISPYNPQNPIDQFFSQTFNHLVNDVALEYFKYGTFNWLSMIKDTNPNAINKIDFLGVNYYSHTLLSSTGPKIRPDEVCADGYPGAKRTKPIYAEGLYKTLKHAATYGFPLVITELGFAAKLESVELRTEYFKKHFYAMHKAMQEGVPLHGCFIWTAFDCFGWNSGQHSTHGIYHVNRETQERTLKENAWYIVSMFNKKPTAETIVRFDQLPKMAH